MKLFKSLLLGVSLLLAAQTLRADEGCSLQFNFNTKITAKYGTTITIIPADPNFPPVIVNPGQALVWGLNNGDKVEVTYNQQAWPCGSVTAFNWGYTVFTQCGNPPGAAQQLYLPGTFVSDIYQTYIDCACPATDGLGWLAENRVGQQCSGPPQR